MITRMNAYTGQPIADDLAPRLIMGQAHWQEKLGEIGRAFSLSWVALAKDSNAADAAASSARRDQTYFTTMQGGVPKFFCVKLAPSSIIVSEQHHTGLIAGAEHAGQLVLATALRFPDEPLTTPLAAQNGYPPESYGRPLVFVDGPRNPKLSEPTYKPTADILGDKCMPLGFGVYLGGTATQEITLVCPNQLAGLSGEFLDYGEVAATMEAASAAHPAAAQ